MKARRLELTNWCQHRDRALDFEDGLNAVIGANGSGKSNTLGAMLFALTGQNPNRGNLEDNVCQTSAETERSMVRFTFSHAGVEARVTRYLRPSAKARLEITGMADLLGAKDVNPRIVDILGIDVDVLRDVVVVQQSEIFSFLAKTPAKRSDTFAKLFQVERALVVCDFLGKKEREVPTVILEDDASLERTRQAHGRYLASRDELRTAVAGYHPEEELIAGLRDTMQRIANYGGHQQTLGAIAQAERSLEADQAELQGFDSACRQLDEDILALHEAVESTEANMVRARDALARLETHKRLAKRRELLDTREVGLQLEFDALRLPPRPKTPQSLPLDAEVVSKFFMEDAVNFKLELEAATKLVATFAGAGLAACPTCGTSVETIQAAVTATIEAIPAMRDNKSRADECYQGWERYRTAQSYYVTERDKLRESLAAVADEKASLADHGAMQVDEAALAAVVEDHAGYTEAIVEFKGLRESNRVGAGRAQGRLTANTDLLRELRSTLDASQVLAGEEGAADESRLRAQQDDLQHQIDSLRIRKQNLNKAEADVVVAARQLEDMERSRRQAAESDAKKAWLGGMRDLVHFQAAPKFVIQRNLRMVQPMMNETLEMFDADFRVEADEGMTFIARFSDGRRQSAERLSAGQQVILAITFRLALNLALAENIGFMALDEPTAYLDERHIAGFTPVLARMREFAASRGFQCIMITHEQGLAPLFDAVVQL